MLFQSGSRMISIGDGERGIGDGERGTGNLERSVDMCPYVLFPVTESALRSSLPFTASHSPFPVPRLRPRPRLLHRVTYEAFELLEVLLEHPRELLRLDVVGSLILPRVTRSQH